VNERQKVILPKKIGKYFGGENSETPLKNKTISVWGLAFKPRTDDMREAPSLVIIDQLLRMGANVRAHDPVAIKEAKPLLPDSVVFSTNQYDILEGADALAIVTEWNEYRNPDFDRIRELLKNPVIFDGRNLYDPRRMKFIGFSYIAIGRNGKNFYC
jgi:UDPglucose 6-dehydrogenase